MNLGFCGFCRRRDVDVYLFCFATTKPLAAKKEEHSPDDDDKDDEHCYYRGIAAATAVICHNISVLRSGVSFSYPPGVVVVLNLRRSYSSSCLTPRLET